MEGVNGSGKSFSRSYTISMAKYLLLQNNVDARIVINKYTMHKLSNKFNHCWNNSISSCSRIRFQKLPPRLPTKHTDNTYKYAPLSVIAIAMRPMVRFCFGILACHAHTCASSATPEFIVCGLNFRAWNRPHQVMRFVSFQMLAITFHRLMCNILMQR